MLQPLSLLTFNIDLLFQHHHLEPDSHSPEIPTPSCQEAGFQMLTERSQPQNMGCKYPESLSEKDFGSSKPQSAKANSSPLANPKKEGSEESTHGSMAPIKATLEQTSPQLLWVQEKEIGALPPPNTEEDSLAQQAGQVRRFVCCC